MSLLSCFSSQSSCCLTVEENGSCCRLKVWCFPIGYISWRSQEVHHTAVWVLISSTTFLIEIWTALLRIRINWLCVCMYIQCRVLVFFLDCYGHVKPTSLRKTNSGGCWNVLEMAAPQIHKMKNEARICSCPFQICMHLPPKVVNHWCGLTKSHKITRVSEKSWSWSQKKAVAEIWNLHLLRMLLLYHLKRLLGLSQAVQDLRTIRIHKIRQQFPSNSHKTPLYAKWGLQARYVQKFLHNLQMV